MTDFKLLETKGFMVIPNFLSNIEVDEILIGYQQLRQTEEFVNANFLLLGGPPSTALKNKVVNLLETISQQSNIKVDTPLTVTYIDTSLVKFYIWHQDHDCYYQFQDLYNFVNCWIPIKKLKLEASNLSLIAHDTLASLIPDVHQRLILGKGQLTFYPSGSKTIVEDHATHEKFTIDININNLQETPYVNAGDLVLYRGDVLHKTQVSNVTDDRISINFRSAYSNTVLTRDNFYTGGKFKEQFINNNPHGYNGIKSKFTEVDQFTLKELIS